MILIRRLWTRMIRVMGVDPGLAHVGWGVVDFNQSRFSLVAEGEIQTPASDNIGARLGTIYRGIEEVIATYTPTMAGVEDLFFAKNRSSAIPVAQAMGAILLCFEDHNIHTEVLTPLVIKQSITGVGRAEKHQVQEMVNLLLGATHMKISDHSADALAAAITFCNYSLPRIKMEAL